VSDSELNSIIVINPGSTSTKLAVYSYRSNSHKDKTDIEPSEILKESSSVTIENRAPVKNPGEDLEVRKALVRDFLEKVGKDIGKVTAVAARGGLLKPLKGGVYRVNQDMIDDLVSCRYGSHASNLGGPVAAAIADEYGVEAYIAYPVVVDEMDDIARYTGIPEIRRKSIFHALNHKSVAGKVAKKLGLRYENAILIVAHLGGGITIGIHVKGKVVDVNNGLDGDGPFSIERAGTVPTGDFLRMCMGGRYTYREMYKKIVGEGGIFAYLGTKDARRIERVLNDKRKADQGDIGTEKERVAELIRAWAYQVAKNICSLSSYTCGKVDAIIITGGLANFSYFVDEIIERVKFLAEVVVVPGEDEMRALAEYTLRALWGLEKIYDYRSER